MRVWERGVGITQACGTGAGASLVAAVLNELIHEEAELMLDGGKLEITWKNHGHVLMTGPAKKVFEGDYFYDATK